MSEPETIVVTILPSQAEIGDRLATTLNLRHDIRGRDFDSVTDHLADLYRAGHAIIAFAACGIVIRALSPVLGDKRKDPAVVAVSPDGNSVVPLLGGHHGGNDLAHQVAEVFEGSTAITTAGDVVYGIALDAPPKGWKLDNPLDAKAVMAGILSGEKVTIAGSANWLGSLPGAEITESASPNRVVLSAGDLPPLVYHRQWLALGVGCARGCAADHMISHVMAVLAQAGLSPNEVAGVHSIDVKADEAAVHALAAHLGVMARFHSAESLEAQKDRLQNPSDIVFAEVGCHGVAEGAALTGAGPGAEFIQPKVKSEQATVAVAGPVAGAEGRQRGSLSVVGIGPGKADWRTGEAGRAVATADELVGYSLYLDLLGPSAKGKVRRDFALGEEEARCRYALEAAGEGRNVALICSGDGGIFAMGALVMELLDRPEDQGGVSAAARRVAITHAPGISALQAASARCGAILGHDFCAISLSDLLTPRAAILNRLNAAAVGDFVCAFYNPVSKRRRDLLDIARGILLDHRPVNTPVILASNLGRPEESLKIIELQDLRVDDVDMLTIVLVGSSESRIVQSGDTGAGAQGRFAYTPRGYAKKMEEIA